MTQHKLPHIYAAIIRRIALSPEGQTASNYNKYKKQGLVEVCIIHQGRGQKIPIAVIDEGIAMTRRETDRIKAVKSKRRGPGTFARLINLLMK
jgi:hypothetical protein